MKITNYSSDKNRLQFVLEETTPAFANTLRRLMIAEVPTLAIENVTFFENSSALYDELIAHRLGLIPIKTDLKSFKEKDTCTCKGKGCPRCQASFTLNKKGPATVYSGDMKSSDPKTVVSDDNIPITKILENQKIKLEAVASLGRGADHAKWQPGVIGYQYYPKITIKDKEAVKTALKDSNHKEALSGETINTQHIELCTRCLTRALDSGEKSIEIEWLKDKIIFTIESNGDLKPDEIVTKAATILGEKAKEFGKQIK